LWSKPPSAQCVRPPPPAAIPFPAAVAEEEGAIQAFPKPHLYRHHRGMRVMGEAGGILFDLFAR